MEAMPTSKDQISKALMRRVHICLEHEKALSSIQKDERRRKVKIRDVLNKIVKMGLAQYAKEQKITLPPLREGEGEEEQEGV